MFFSYFSVTLYTAYLAYSFTNRRKDVALEQEKQDALKSTNDESMDAEPNPERENKPRGH